MTAKKLLLYVECDRCGVEEAIDVDLALLNKYEGSKLTTDIIRRDLRPSSWGRVRIEGKAALRERCADVCPKCMGKMEEALYAGKEEAESHPVNLDTPEPNQ